MKLFYATLQPWALTFELFAAVDCHRDEGLPSPSALYSESEPWSRNQLGAGFFNTTPQKPVQLSFPTRPGTILVQSIVASTATKWLTSEV